MAMLRGFNWARWLFVLWFGYNVIGPFVLGSPKPTPQNLLGTLLMVTAAYLVFRPAATAFFRTPASVAPHGLPEGHAPCADCGGAFGVEDMVRHGSFYVCAGCKPRFLQKLREGAEYGVTEEPHR
jgi:hypothetical protein